MFEQANREDKAGVLPGSRMVKSAGGNSRQSGVSVWLPRAVIYRNNVNPSYVCRDVVALDVITPAVGDGPPVAAA